MTELTGPGRKPLNKPNRPYFSSGPCAKPPGWALEKLATDSLVALIAARSARRACNTAST